MKSSLSFVFFLKQDPALPYAGILNNIYNSLMNILSVRVNDILKQGSEVPLVGILYNIYNSFMSTCSMKMGDMLSKASS